MAWPPRRAPDHLHCVSGCVRPKENRLLNSVISKVFGTSNERAVKRMLPLVEQINALEPAIAALSDEELRGKTAEFRQRINDAVIAVKGDAGGVVKDAAGADAVEGEAGDDLEERIHAAEKATLDAILPEAFAVVREAG